MLTTGNVPEYDDYHFKDSPESSTDSYMTDYLDINSDEDFLQQLSSDLDIPLLLNSNDDDLGILNSIMDKSPDEILSEMMSPVSTITNFQDIGDEIKELQQVDVTQWGPDAFPNLKAESNMNYIKSESPTPSHSSDDSTKYCTEVKEEIIIDTPPISPNNNTIHINLSNIQPSIVIDDTNSQFNGRLSTVKRNMLYSKSVHTKSRKRLTLSPNVNNQTILPIPVNRSLSDNVLIIEGAKLPISSLQNNTTTTTNVMNLNPCIPITGLPVIVNQGDGIINNAMEIDTRALKRQQRMIKNRESAILSRKKKKEYLTTLEKQVQELTLENALLKKENVNLKERLSVLSQNLTSVFKLPNKNLTKSMGLCIFLFIVCLNLDFAGKQLNLKTNNIVPDNTVQLTNHRGRNLLWNQDVDSDEKQLINETANIVSLPICPMHVNQTESVRLALELHRWIGKPYNDSIGTTESQYQIKSKPSRFKYRSKLRLRSRSEALNTPIIPQMYRIGKRTKNVDAQMSGNELELFVPTPEQLYAEFFEAINRKDDTFYVVSFNADHMLLPALNHNKTRRPKMSLILPSMISNDTNHNTSGISLMQIDCEVIDTRLINVEDKAIPQHFKPTGNTTNTSNKHKLNVRQKLKKPYKPYFMNKLNNSTLNVDKLP